MPGTEAAGAFRRTFDFFCRAGGGTSTRSRREPAAESTSFPTGNDRVIKINTISKFQKIQNDSAHAPAAPCASVAPATRCERGTRLVSTRRGCSNSCDAKSCGSCVCEECAFIFTQDETLVMAVDIICLAALIFEGAGGCSGSGGIFAAVSSFLMRKTAAVQSLAFPASLVISNQVAMTEATRERSMGWRSMKQRS